MKGILFLCVANSVRSQMAEGIARALAPAGLAVWSAGSYPGSVHPLAVAALAEIDIDISRQTSKGIGAVPLEAVDTVVTLCREESCPLPPRLTRRLHWPLADPTAAADPLEAFRRVRDDLRGRIAALLRDEGSGPAPSA